MRCFVALDLPAPVRNHVANVVRPLCARFALRVVAADQLHLTLLFAADLDGAAVDELAHIVRDVELGPLSLHLQRLGHFPPRGLPRVVWAGVGGDVDAVAALHDAIATRAQPLGVEREKRGFTPHVTVARVTSDFGALALVDALRTASNDLRPKPFAPTRLAVYASELTPRGPVHSLLHDRAVPSPRG